MGVVGPRGNQNNVCESANQAIVATWPLITLDLLTNGHVTELRKDRRSYDWIVTLRKTNRKMGNMTKVSHLCLILSKKTIAHMSSVPAGAINVKEHLATDS